MPAPPDDARSQRVEVIDVRPIGSDGVLLRVATDEPLPPVRASRFFMLRREDELSPAIPRPFSIYRQDGRELEFLIKVMGRGTRALAACEPGDRLRCIGPLGNGWPELDADGPPWVLLAGGVGCAPFWMTIEQGLRGSARTPALPADRMTYLFGAANRGFLYDHERLPGLGVDVHFATDDGSLGHRGNVLQLLDRKIEAGELPAAVRILACGPDPMLRAVSAWSEERELPCWLSLETLMGCGVGICNGCPVPTRPEGPRGAWPNVKCCVEGPVFRADEILV